MKNKRLRVPDIGQVAGERNGVDELLAGRSTALDSETQNGAEASLKDLARTLVPGMIRESVSGPAHEA